MAFSVGRCGGPLAAAILADVGYNPYRRFRARPFDYALVAVCLLIAVALVVWALAG